MLTLDYLIHANNLATRKSWSATIRGMYTYLFCECLSNSSDYLTTSLNIMSADLKISKTTASRSLKTLQEARLVKRIATGIYGLIAPPLNSRETKVEPPIFSSNSRARVDDQPVTTPLRRRVVTATEATKPRTIVIPSLYEDEKLKLVLERKIDDETRARNLEKAKDAIIKLKRG